MTAHVISPWAPCPSPRYLPLKHRSVLCGHYDLMGGHTTHEAACGGGMRGLSAPLFTRSGIRQLRTGSRRAVSSTPPPVYLSASQFALFLLASHRDPIFQVDRGRSAAAWQNYSANLLYVRQFFPFTERQNEWRQVPSLLSVCYGPYHQLHMHCDSTDPVFGCYTYICIYLADVCVNSTLQTYALSMSWLFCAKNTHTEQPRIKLYIYICK